MGKKMSKIKTIKSLWKNNKRGLFAAAYNYLVATKVTDVLSDKTFLKLTYKIRIGRSLDLNNPQGFNEKIQWLKLYDRNPEYNKMVDKHAVKDYVAKKIGEEYVVPTLGVWEKFKDIDFAKLPEQFVLKCTHDSGSVIVCSDKHFVHVTVVLFCRIFCAYAIQIL